jgi:hypothetical protein
VRTIKFCIIVVHLGYTLEVVINTVIFEDSRTVIKFWIVYFSGEAHTVKSVNVLAM